MKKIARDRQDELLAVRMDELYLDTKTVDALLAAIGWVPGGKRPQAMMLRRGLFYLRRAAHEAKQHNHDLRFARAMRFQHPFRVQKGALSAGSVLRFLASENYQKHAKTLGKIYVVATPHEFDVCITMMRRFMDDVCDLYRSTPTQGAIMRDSLTLRGATPQLRFYGRLWLTPSMTDFVWICAHRHKADKYSLRRAVQAATETVVAVRKERPGCALAKRHSRLRQRINQNPRIINAATLWHITGCENCIRLTRQYAPDKKGPDHRHRDMRIAREVLQDMYANWQERTFDANDKLNWFLLQRLWLDRDDAITLDSYLHKLHELLQAAWDHPSAGNAYLKVDLEDEPGVLTVSQFIELADKMEHWDVRLIQRQLLPTWRAEHQRQLIRLAALLADVLITNPRPQAA